MPGQAPQAHFDLAVTGLPNRRIVRSPARTEWKGSQSSECCRAEGPFGLEFLKFFMIGPDARRAVKRAA